MNPELRVVSLAPTQTEIVAALGRIESLLGITENCDHPHAVSGLPTFGTWYAPDLHGVVLAQPHLVCTFGKHQEEMRDALIDAGLRVYHSDPGNVREAFTTILELAEIMDRREVGKTLLEKLQARLESVSQTLGQRKHREKPGVFRIMHWDPLITVGPGSFQHDVIELAGGRNVMGDGPAPYFVCQPHEVRVRNPQVIFFCEPQIRDLLKNDPSWQEVSALQKGRVFTFDCGLTCRSGPRIVDMVEQLAQAIRS